MPSMVHGYKLPNILLPVIIILVIYGKEGSFHAHIRALLRVSMPVTSVGG